MILPYNTIRHYEEFTGKSSYANFFKLKHKIMLGKFHVRRGLPVYAIACTCLVLLENFEIGKEEEQS